MERPYANSHRSWLTPTLFVGEEVENSKFRGERTLFVPILISKNSIELKKVISTAQEKACTHVYLGANKLDKVYDWAVVVELISASLNVTLDINARNYLVLSSIPWGLLDPKRFNLMISLEVPSIHANMVSVKIDDVGFDATNKGVWVAPVETLAFTTWDQYTKDTLI